jgi:hypothetical protein
MRVSSSAISEVFYARKTQTLFVNWRKTKSHPEGRQSAHFHVPWEVWQALKQSESKGSFFWNNIKDKYPWKYVEEDK